MIAWSSTSVPELADRRRAPEIPDNAPAQMCEDSSSSSTSSSSDSSWESGAPFAAEEEDMPEQPALFKSQTKGQRLLSKTEKSRAKESPMGQGTSTNPFSTCPKMCSRCSSDNHLDIYYVRIMHPQSFFPICVQNARSERSVQRSAGEEF